MTTGKQLRSIRRAAPSLLLSQGTGVRVPVGVLASANQRGVCSRPASAAAGGARHEARQGLPIAGSISEILRPIAERDAKEVGANLLKKPQAKRAILTERGSADAQTEGLRINHLGNPTIISPIATQNIDLIKNGQKKQAAIPVACPGDLKDGDQVSFWEGTSNIHGVPT